MSSNLFWYTGGMIERAQETQRESTENCVDTKIHKERKNKTDVHRGGGGRKEKNLWSKGVTQRETSGKKR